jgi:hypothetical protein
MVSKTLPSEVRNAVQLEGQVTCLLCCRSMLPKREHQHTVANPIYVSILTGLQAAAHLLSPELHPSAALSHSQTQSLLLPLQDPCTGMAGQPPLEAPAGEAAVLMLLCSQCVQGGKGLHVAAVAGLLSSVSAAAPVVACELLLHLRQALLLALVGR